MLPSACCRMGTSSASVNTTPLVRTASVAGRASKPSPGRLVPTCRHPTEPPTPVRTYCVHPNHQSTAALSVRYNTADSVHTLCLMCVCLLALLYYALILKDVTTQYKGIMLSEIDVTASSWLAYLSTKTKNRETACLSLSECKKICLPTPLRLTN